MNASFAPGSIGFDMLREIEVRLSVELGQTQLPLREVMGLAPDAIVPLDRATDELLDLYANGRRIARGEVVAQDGRFALRIVELCGSENAERAPTATPADTADAVAMAAAVSESPVA